MQKYKLLKSVFVDILIIFENIYGYVMVTDPACLNCCFVIFIYLYYTLLYSYHCLRLGCFRGC